MYISLAELKKHLNIDSSFTDDDTYLQSLEKAGEEVVSLYINRDLVDLEDENHNIPKSLMHAILLWVGSMYNTRESISTSSYTQVPGSFELLCDLYRKYDKN